MITESFISTILQASITGAGLLLAVYGIIIPVFRKVIQYRVNSLTNFIKQIKEKPASEFLFKEDSIENVKESLDYIDEMRKLPSYFSKTVIVAFLGYIASALMCLFWFVEWNKPFMEKWIPWLFGISCVLFAYIGFKTIKDLMGLVKIKHEQALKDAAQAIDAKKPMPKRRKKKK